MKRLETVRAPWALMIGLASLLGFWSCESGTGAGNPGSEVHLSMRLAGPAADVGKDSALAFTDAQGTVFRILSAQAHVRDIRLDLPDSSDCRGLDVRPPVTCTAERLEAKGPFRVDLLAGTSLPEWGRIPIPAGTYSRLDVRFSEAEGKGNPVPAGHALAGNTLILAAEFAWKGRVDRRLELALKFTEDMRFEAEGGLRLQPATAYSLVMGLRVDRWMRNVGITKCLEDGDLSLDASGNLSLSEGQGRGGCSSIENTIKDNLKNSGDLSALPLEN